jgi:hypothetical protein
VARPAQEKRVICDVCRSEQFEVVHLRRGAVAFSAPADLELDQTLNVCWRCLDYRTLRQVALGNHRPLRPSVGFET